MQASPLLPGLKLMDIKPSSSAINTRTAPGSTSRKNPPECLFKYIVKLKKINRHGQVGTAAAGSGRGAHGHTQF